MITTFEIEDTQTLNMFAFAHFFDGVQGRTDIWLDVEEEKPQRIMLLNDSTIEFPENVSRKTDWGHSHSHWTEYLEAALYGCIGKPHKLVVIFDDVADSQSFQEHLDLTATKRTTFFDLPERSKPDGDPQALHEWLSANVKGRVIVWLTQGTGVYDVGETLNQPEWVYDHWFKSEDTMLLGIYDKSDPNAWPAQNTSGIPGQVYHYSDPGMFCRVIFRDPKEAMLFRLSWPTATKSIQPERKADFI